MKYIIGILFVVLISCSKKEEQIDKNLIFFKTSFLAELGNDDYEKVLAKTKLKINAQYLEDLIIVTNYVETNACGQYVGNIRIKKDRIYLVYKLMSEEVCTSTSVEKVTYIINNPKEKKYKFEMKYE
jgi:hypothetical protein